MDRSLLFFLSGPNPQNRPDSRTGLSTSENSVQFDVTKYDPSDPRSTTSEQRTVNFTVVNSLQSEGQFMNYLGNSSTNDFRPVSFNPEHESDIKLSSIIQWTQDNKPALKLNAFHFAYLKNFNVYPANRIAALRRFKEAVPHDIMNTQTKALNTMITYYDFEKPFSFDFNEVWEDFNKGLYELIQDVIGIKFNNVGGAGSWVSDAIKGLEAASVSNLEQYLLQSVGHKLGLITTGDNLFGDPNVIYQSKIRRANGEDIENNSSGLECNFRYQFETTYVLAELNGIDARAAMLDIIANTVHMGTSNSRFILTHNASDGLSAIIKEMERGNVDGLLSKVLEGLIEGMKKVGEGLSELLGAFKPVVSENGETTLSGVAQGVSNGIEKVVSGILRDRFSRYKWQMRGAIGALSGMHTAPWHLTIGNPKAPWFTIGNLVVTKVDMNFGGEMGYNDMPTELTVKISLENGRPLGANEITSLFNNGRGRIYDTPEAIQKIYIPNNEEHYSSQSLAPSPFEDTENITIPPSSPPVNNTPPSPYFVGVGAGYSEEVEDEDQEMQIENTSDFSLNKKQTDDDLENSLLGISQ